MIRWFKTREESLAIIENKSDSWMSNDCLPRINEQSNKKLSPHMSAFRMQSRLEGVLGKAQNAWKPAWDEPTTASFQ